MALRRVCSWKSLLGSANVETSDFPVENCFTRSPAIATCRNAYEKQGKGFATPILGLKMFTTITCEKEDSMDEQRYETKSSTVFGGVNRMKCKSCETYFGSRGFGLYWVFEFMNQSLCADAKEEEIVADFYLSESKRNELSLPTRPHFSNDWMCTAMFVVYFLKSVFFDRVKTCCPSHLRKTWDVTKA
ncbi:unnamed protein product [Bathycoccus prasinos]